MHSLAGVFERSAEKERFQVLRLLRRRERRDDSCTYRYTIITVKITPYSYNYLSVRALSLTIIIIQVTTTITDWEWRYYNIYVTEFVKTDHFVIIQFVQYGPQALPRSQSGDFAMSTPRCSTVS